MIQNGYLIEKAQHCNSLCVHQRCRQISVLVLHVNYVQL